MCFNGAAALRPRKCAEALSLSFTILALQWGRGLAAAEIFWPVLLLSRMLTLQWGRGLAAAEMPTPRTSRWPSTPGFNGAAALRPRKCFSTVEPKLVLTLLQWGRGLAAAEISRGCCGTTFASTTLQWGRGLAAAEISARATWQTAPWTGFNGAAALRPRK